MSPAEAAAFLRRYNEWRRGELDDLSMPDPREIGEAIDAAVEMIDRLEAAEADALEQARLNGMGSEREAALMAKLEAAEKERDWHADRCEDVMDECARLRSKIEAIERQEPVKYEKRIKLRSKHTWGAWWECDKSAYVKAKAAGGHYPKFSDDLLDYEMRPLYALPGAKGEEK